MKKNRTANSGERGVIMMETLIMLPVYLVLLACIFWLGELCLIRQTLTTAERVRLWEDGTRHSISQIAETTLFQAFLETPGRAVTATRQQVVTGVSNLSAMQDQNTTGFQTNNTTRSWGVEKSGFVQLNTRRSEWSWGIVNVFRSLFWGGWDDRSQVSSGREVMSMKSRVNASGTPLSSSVLFRLNNAGYRAKVNGSWDATFSGSLVWNNIYHEQWGNYIHPDSQGAPGATTLYNRYGNYVIWSR